MITSMLALLEGRIGLSVFLIATLMGYAGVYMIMTYNIELKRKCSRYIALVLCMLLTDGVWIVYNNISELWHGDPIINMFFEFAAAGMIFFAGIIFMSLRMGTYRVRLRRLLFAVYIVCLSVSFTNCFSVAFASESIEAFKKLIMDINFGLNIIIIILMYVIGLVSGPVIYTTQQKKVLALGLACMMGVMVVVFIITTLKDMGFISLCFTAVSDMMRRGV